MDSDDVAAARDELAHDGLRGVLRDMDRGTLDPGVFIHVPNRRRNENYEQARFNVPVSLLERIDSLYLERRLQGCKNRTEAMLHCLVVGYDRTIHALEESYDPRIEQIAAETNRQKWQAVITSKDEYAEQLRTHQGESWEQALNGLQRLREHCEMKGMIDTAKDINRIIRDATEG